MSSESAETKLTGELLVGSQEPLSSGFQLWASTSGLAQYWPQWRGPNRDGVVQGVKPPDKWPKALKEEWKVTVGEGVSCPGRGR